MTQNENYHMVETTLNYHSEDTDSFVAGTAGHYLRSFDPKTVHIRDVRGHESTYSLDKHGFEFHDHVSRENDCDDEAKIEEVVYKEITELLKQKTGASRVFPFSNIVRREKLEDLMERAKKAENKNATVEGRGPARVVHVDQSYEGAVMTLEYWLPDEAAKLCERRWGIVNVWRPLSTVPRDPLAVCDGSTVSEADLVRVSVELPEKMPKPSISKGPKGRKFETWGAIANSSHKWYFKSDMRPDEVILIKCFDSKKDGRVRSAPHTAFVDPATKDNPATRNSIEIRCFVFWEDEDTE